MSQAETLTLCLSGGGYRAAIYHLGALTWLNDCGLLSRLTRVSSVSGGSIAAGHVAYRFRDGWPTVSLDRESWQERIVEPFFAFVNRDIRTWPILSRIVNPLNWFQPSSTSEALRREYARHLFQGNDLELVSILASPQFVFCATDMVFGVNWEASRRRVGDFEAGYVEPPPPNWTLSRAVAASSCFPPVFPPSKTHLSVKDFQHGDYQDQDALTRRAAIRLTDGGVYDNLGLEPAMNQKNVPVSDGGGQLEFALLNLPWRHLARYPALLQNGIGKLRKRMLMRDYSSHTKYGTYWSIADGATVKGHANQDQATLISRIRTDLNRFTRAEFEILQNHGYLCAARKTITKCQQLLDRQWTIEEITVPYSGSWVDAKHFDKWLKFSARRFYPYWFR